MPHASTGSIAEVALGLQRRRASRGHFRSWSARYASTAPCTTPSVARVARTPDLPPLARAEEQEQTSAIASAAANGRARARPRAAQEAPAALPREEDRLLALPAFAPSAHPAKLDIWMSGIRIEIAMKPTAPPMTTIISGSSRLVSVCTRGLDLGVVGVGHALEHALELPALLADGDHVGHDRRELAAPLERLGDALALADRADRLLDDLLERARCRARSSRCPSP